MTKNLNKKELSSLLDRVYQLAFLTSGQCLIFDKEGKQIGDLQIEFSSGQTNMPLLKQIAERAEKFTLGKFREWSQEMNREDFMRITHLHTV